MDKETLISVCRRLRQDVPTMLAAVEHLPIPERIDVLKRANFLNSWFYTPHVSYLFSDIKEKFIRRFLEYYGSEGLARTTIFDLILKDYYNLRNSHLDLSEILEDLNEQYPNDSDLINVVFATNKAMTFHMTKKEVFDEVWKWCLDNRCYNYDTTSSETIYYTKQCND